MARSAVGLTQENLALALEISVSTVSRWENGQAKPVPPMRPKLAKLLRVSLAELDHLLLRSVRGGQADHAVKSVSNESSAGSRLPQFELLDGLRRSIIGQGASADGAPDSDWIVQAVSRAHRLYQHADYDAAAELLPRIISYLNDQHPSPRMAAQRACGYVAAAKLATKLGDGSLAWLAADRANLAAQDSGQVTLIGLARYQVACALLLNGHLVDAQNHAMECVEELSMSKKVKETQAEISVQGALLLLSAVIAARSGDYRRARDLLSRARELASVLRCEGNFLWTGFGSTNVAIHELSVAVQLGDARRSYELGAVIDTDRLPAVLVGRRSQVHLDLSRAAMGMEDDGLAVLHLLEAERVANQAVSRNASARDTVRVLLGRERRNATPGLRALALRAGVDA